MSVTTKPALKVSREGVILIKSFEGFRPRAIQGDDGRWMIGYGHKASAREGLTVGEQDAELLLQYDLLPVVKALNERVSTGLNQHQFDALASFAISVGVDRFLSSDVLQRVNDGRSGEAADALIGWPETTAPDVQLRRRAAERALFVADPASPVHLSDLLAAPLPPPPVAPTETPIIQPVFSPLADARAAAVASLLGEAPPAETPIPGPEPVVPFKPTPFRPLPATAAIQLQRYSPYSAAIIGPLPGFPLASETKAGVVPTPVEPAAVEVEAAPAEADALTPAQAPALEPAYAPVAAPVAPLVTPPPGPSPFPPLDAPLVLTPATEADFLQSERPIWPEEQRTADPAVDETVLFEEEPTVSVLRHEAEPTEPRRFDWSETGAYLIMGGLGLASCAFSAGAFRLSVEQPSPMGETTLIAWVLAVIGAICVGVSSWNLYVRWGRPN